MMPVISMRSLLSLMVAVLVALPASAFDAWSEGKSFRIGFVALVSPGVAEQWLKAVRSEFVKLGYVEGSNLVIDARFANGDRSRLKEIVADLARTKVDVFVTAGEPALLAAKADGENVPIVTVTCDPPEKLMGSLARPGGNATGFTCISSDLTSKRLGLLKAMLPQSKRIAVLYSEPDTSVPELDDLAVQSSRLGLEAMRYPVRSAEDFAETFKQMAERRADAVYIVASSFA